MSSVVMESYFPSSCDMNLRGSAALMVPFLGRFLTLSPVFAALVLMSITWSSCCKSSTSKSNPSSTTWLTSVSMLIRPY